MVEPEFLPQHAPYWLIDGIPARVEGGQPRHQPGEEDTYDLELKPDAFGDLVGTGMSDHIDRWRALRERGRHSNVLTMHVTLEDKVLYSFDLDEYDPLVSVRPGQYDEIGIGIWGLVTNVDGSPSLTESIIKFSVDVAFIAEYDRYPDKGAVRAEHEYKGFR